MPTRVVHCKREKYDVYIGRPSIWGNPFTIGRDGTREEVMAKCDEWLNCKRHISGREPPALQVIYTELKDKTLGCWCSPKSCHGDIYVRLVKEFEAKVREVYDSKRGV